MRTIQRNIVGAFLFSADNKLLLGKSIKGGVYPDAWIVPGGGIEPNETKLDALQRETLEETGIDIGNAKVEEIEGSLTGQSEKILRDTGEKVLVDMKFYNYKIILPQLSGDIELSHEDDFIQAKWFSFDELKDIQLSLPTVKTLKKMKLM